MSADLEFEKLVQDYYGDLYRFGLSLAGNETDAADLTQETFYIWANKGHQLQKAASVKSWLFTTLHREFLKSCRHRNRFSNESIDEATVLRDASLITNVDLVTGRVWRRIKHFSGYSVLSGLECVVSELDPDCVESPINPHP